MAEHMKLRDIPKFCIQIENWLKERYGEAEGSKLWKETSDQYTILPNARMQNLPRNII